MATFDSDGELQAGVTEVRNSSGNPVRVDPPEDTDGDDVRTDPPAEAPAIGTVNRPKVNIRKQPRPNSTIVESVREGDQLPIGETRGGWIEISDRGWIRSDLLD